MKALTIGLFVGGWMAAIGGLVVAEAVAAWTVGALVQRGRAQLRRA
jgi:hypothetical protein